MSERSEASEGGVGGTPGMWRGLWKSARPHQWVKNGFVFAPLIFAQQLDDPLQLLRGVLATVLFCGASSSVYLMNDVLDVAKDRAHPVKRFRPIASGVVSPRFAERFAMGLALLAVSAGVVLAPWFGACVAGYLALNVAYSVRLKHMVYLDVATIALGFLLRILAGAFAIDVRVSFWLFACTFLIALYLGFGKRRHELATAGDRSSAQRSVLEHYEMGRLNLVMFGTALATTAAYTGYTLDPHTREVFGTTWMPATVPFILFGLLRFLVLTGRVDQHASPTELIVRDPPFVLNVLAWGALAIYLIYLR